MYYYLLNKHSPYVRCVMYQLGYQVLSYENNFPNTRGHGRKHDGAVS